MSEIVYYDANPTVRAILTRQFEQYGLDVVAVPSLEQYEETLKNCSHPVVLVADLSRNPAYLSELQKIVPKYIRDPERCILTSVDLPSLAPYLPANVDDCFFKHVVERPFKRLDFIQFFDGIIQPYLASSTSICRHLAAKSVNSSVEQITGHSVSMPLDEVLVREVDGIVENTSAAISLEKIQNSADAELSVQRCCSRMSRRSRAIPYSELVRNADGSQARSDDSQPRLRDQSRFVRESSSQRRDACFSNNDPHSRAVPATRSRSLSSQPTTEMTAPASDKIEQAIESLADFEKQALNARVSPRRAIANPHHKKNSIIENHNIDIEEPKTTDNEPQREEECTMLDSPAVMLGNIEPIVTSPSSLMKVDDGFERGTFEIPKLIAQLKFSMIRQQLYTIVVKRHADELVLFLDRGRIKWIEQIVDARIPDAADFLGRVSMLETVPVGPLLNLVNRKMSLSDAFVSLELEKIMIGICQRCIQAEILQIRSFEGCTCEIWCDVPEKWMPLLLQRPVSHVDVMPYLFDELRESSDLLIVPEFFQHSRFAMRAWSTPLNESIQLNDDERELLKCLHSPATIADLRRFMRKGVAEIIYRLVLFEFADFVL